MGESRELMGRFARFEEDKVEDASREQAELTPEQLFAQIALDFILSEVAYKDRSGNEKNIPKYWPLVTNTRAMARLRYGVKTGSIESDIKVEIKEKKLTIDLQDAIGHLNGEHEGDFLTGLRNSFVQDADEGERLNKATEALQADIAGFIRSKLEYNFEEIKIII